MIDKENCAMLDKEQGLNCAQSVLKQFSEDYGLDSRMALLLASGFGGGMWIGSACGALTGGLMALGIAYGFTDPMGKELFEPYALELMKRFEEVMGSVNCRDIIGIDTCNPVQKAKAIEEGIYAIKCPLAIRTAVQIVESIHRQAKQQ